MELRLELVFPESTEPAVRKELDSRDLKVGPAEEWEPNSDELKDYAEAPFEPLTIITCTISAVALLETVAEISERFMYPGGELWDVRNGKRKRRPLPTQAKGTLVILTDQGEKRFKPEERKTGLAFLEKILRALVEQ